MFQGLEVEDLYISRGYYSAYYNCGLLEVFKILYSNDVLFFFLVQINLKCAKQEETGAKNLSRSYFSGCLRSFISGSYYYGNKDKFLGKNVMGSIRIDFQLSGAFLQHSLAPIGSSQQLFSARISHLNSSTQHYLYGYTLESPKIGYTLPVPF